MRGGKNTRGYTIVEVMIFLAISGFMFVVAAIFVSGKQATTEFKQGMNSINSQVQQVISDVGNGFYPSTANFSCSASTTGGTPPQIISGNSEQGTNQGCVFLGKVMQFNVNGQAATYNIFSLAARQNIDKTTSDAPSKFAQAVPVAVTTPIDLTEQQTIEDGVQVTGMYKTSVAVANSIGAVGFFGSFDQSPNGSSQTVTAVPIPNSTYGQSKAAMATTLNNPGEPANLDTALAAAPNPTIIICFQGGNNLFGSLTIGGTGGQRLSTSIRTDTTAARAGC